MTKQKALRAVVVLLFAFCLFPLIAQACTPCDLDDNGVVAQYDFNRFLDLMFFGSPNPTELCAADFNQDGVINGLDIQGWTNQCSVSCFQASDCGDNNLCTQDVCGFSTGCQHPPVTCDLGFVCNPGTGACDPENICGNGVMEPPEQCEFDKQCPQGLVALAEAVVDVSDDRPRPTRKPRGASVCYQCQCIPQPVCGDGQITGEEICDSQGNLGCTDFVCQTTCPLCDACVSTDICCGDGNVDKGEVCDGGSTCENGTPCVRNMDCTGIGSGICQYRQQFAGGCDSNCTVLSDLLVANFNQAPPNSLGGGFGAWQSEPAVCTFQLQAGGSPDGTAGRVAYHIDQPGLNVFCGFYMQFGANVSQNPFDASAYRTLKFNLRGDSGAGFTTKFRIEMKSLNQPPVLSTYIAKNITSQWQTYSIPLKAFAGGFDQSQITELTIVFEKPYTQPPIGAIFIDQVMLSPVVTDLVVADFETPWPANAGGPQTNTIRGQFNPWNGFPGDPTQHCDLVLNQPDALGSPTGFSVKLTHDVDSPNPAFCGFYSELGPVTQMGSATLDARDYRLLKFYVKGNNQTGFTTQFRIELVKGNGSRASHLVTGITENWQPITIPLEQFFPVGDLSDLDEFVVVFEDTTTDPKVGEIFLDDLRLTRE